MRQTDMRVLGNLAILGTQELLCWGQNEECEIHLAQYPVSKSRQPDAFSRSQAEHKEDKLGVALWLLLMASTLPKAL